MRSPRATFGRHRWSMVASSTLLVSALFAGPAAAAGPVVTVDPAGPLASGAQTLTVTGTGFDAVGNSGNGVYVVFGPVTAAPTYYMDPSIYSPGLKWVHPGAQSSPAEAVMAADGSFTTTLDIQSGFDNTAGHVDCAIVACAVITIGAHGSQDRSQDTCTSVPFVAGDAGASVSPGASAAPVPSAAPASMAPVGSATPVGSGGPADPAHPSRVRQPPDGLRPTEMRRPRRSGVFCTVPANRTLRTGRLPRYKGIYHAGCTGYPNPTYP